MRILKDLIPHLPKVVKGYKTRMQSNYLNYNI